ncbi:MAG: hypothetical protein ACXAC7_20695 [Candidatus Hodarchaeales archaeon]|jgi:hypothetical protein
MNKWIQKRLDIENMNKSSQILAFKYFLLNTVLNAQSLIVGSFLILFILDIITFQDLGLLLALEYGLTFLFDYPTGAIGDTTIFLLLSDSLSMLIPYAIMTALGRSQESGALRSWFDNNYKITIGNFDPNRKIFGAFMGKVMIVYRLLAGSLFLLSGIIAFVFSRQALFVIQIGILIVGLFLIISLMSNVEGTKKKEDSTQGLRAYFNNLKGGLTFVASSKGLTLYFIGFAIVIASTAHVWGRLMMMPYYESYAGTDEYIGLLRSLVYIFGIGGYYVSVWITKKAEKIYRFLFIATFNINITYFLILLGFYTFLPPEYAFNLFKYVGFILIMMFIPLWGGLQNILDSRLMVEIVPSQYRNAVYSLLPTLIIVFGLPFLISGGLILGTDFKSGFILVLGVNSVGMMLYGLGIYWLSRTKVENVLYTEKHLVCVTAM